MIEQNQTPKASKMEDNERKRQAREAIHAGNLCRLDILTLSSGKRSVSKNTMRLDLARGLHW
jgi:hypothetical protein